MEKLSLAEGKNLTLAETVTYVQTKLATSICSVAEEYCVGPVPQQYQNTASCYDYLTTITRFEEDAGFFPVKSTPTRVTGCNTLHLSHGPSE